MDVRVKRSECTGIILLLTLMTVVEHIIQCFDSVGSVAAYKKLLQPQSFFFR